jgi:DNA-binding LytR/AlgR family response regulator
MLRCIALDDEPLALEKVRACASGIAGMELVATFEDAQTALPFLDHTRVDAVFLDVRLGDVNGMDLLAAGRITAPVVLTTAYKDYAVTAYDLRVVDYLLKPYSMARFSEAVAKVRAARQAFPDAVLVKAAGRLERIPLADILFIEGQRDYRRIHTSTRRVMTDQTFASFERVFPADVLCRVHKSFMVAVAKVDTVTRSTLTIGSTAIPISDGYRRRIQEILRRP